MIEFSKLKIPVYSSKEIEQIVEPLITSIGSPPIEVELIAERKGFDLIPIEGLRNLSSTDAYLSTHLKQIAYDPNVVNNRIRFSIAHELGHYYLHKEILDAVRFESFDKWKKTIKEIPGWFWGTVEKQANQFAAKLLVPRRLIIATIPDYSFELSAAKLIIPDDIDAIREFLAVPLARKFEVSEDVIRIRLERENINPYEFI
jgi:Zn-dependent peptidase ImmA (M78 family)